jgi:hypothetical protein
MLRNDKYLTDKGLAQKAFNLVDVVESGLFGAYAWNIKGRSITSKCPKGFRYTRKWYLNGVSIEYRYIYLLTLRLTGLI